MTTSRWHPATKLLVLAGALAVPYLLWTGGDGGGAGGVAQATRAGAAVDPGASAEAEIAAEEAAVAAGRRVLPPLQTFAAAVERPLFTPSRRLVRPVEAPPPEDPGEPVLEEVAAEAGPDPEPEVGRPELRFFGTVRQRGRVTALVTRDGEPAMEQLGVGDEVEAWRVAEVTRDRLVLAYEGETVTYSIFGEQQATP